MKKILIIVALLFTFTFVGCGAGHVEDTNGEDDFTLQTITDEDICNKRSHSAFNTRKNQNGGNTTFKVEKITGVIAIQTLHLKNKDFTMNIESTVLSGNLRLVVVVDKKIVKEIPINEAAFIELENVTGKLEIIAAGESANIDVKFTVVTK